jgi:hypothetical protein
MEIYKTEQRFDPKTGAPSKPVKTWKETRCDFSGRVVESVEDKGYPAYYCKFDLDYGSQDPCFGCGGEGDGDEGAFGNDVVDMFQFLSRPYVIFDDSVGDYNDGGPESEMPAFLKALGKLKGNRVSLDGALREMRVRTANRLIKEGIIQPEELNED